MTDLVRLLVELLRSVWGWVVWFSPLKITVIEDGEAGARKTLGRFHKRTLGPGTYFATSLQVIESDSALACQAEPDGRVEVFTKEGVPLDLYAVAPYNVTDYPANARQANAEGLATQVLEAALVDVFSRRTIRTSIGPPGRLRSAVRKAMQARADELALGIRVTGVEITGREVKEPAVLRALNLGTIEGLIGEGSLVSADATAILAGAVPVITSDQSVESGG